jgi:hypothetical protein
MIIVNQGKSVIVNFENVDAIGFKSNEFDKKTIIAHLIGGNSVELATYETEEKAKKEFERLIDIITEKNYERYYMTAEVIENVEDTKIQD